MLQQSLLRSVSFARLPRMPSESCRKDAGNPKASVNSVSRVFGPAQRLEVLVMTSHNQCVRVRRDARPANCVMPFRRQVKRAPGARMRRGEQKRRDNYHGASGELLWRFYKEMNEDVMSSANAVMERMMRKVSRNFPYEK